MAGALKPPRDVPGPKRLQPRPQIHGLRPQRTGTTTTNRSAVSHWSQTQLEIAHRTSLDQKDFSPTPRDYKSMDLDYKKQKLWSGTTNFEVWKFRVHLKREIRPKRDIVDTSFHASCAFGHAPILGLAFSHLWGDGTRKVLAWVKVVYYGICSGLWILLMGLQIATWRLKPGSLTPGSALLGEPSSSGQVKIGFEAWTTNSKCTTNFYYWRLQVRSALRIFTMGDYKADYEFESGRFLKPLQGRSDRTVFWSGLRISTTNVYLCDYGGL